MILQIISADEPEYIQGILEKKLNQDDYEVTYLRSYGTFVNEFLVKNKTHEEKSINYETLTEIVQDLNLYPWYLRILLSPSI